MGKFKHTGSSMDTYEGEERPRELIGENKDIIISMNAVDLREFMNDTHYNIEQSISRANQIAQYTVRNYRLTQNKQHFRTVTPRKRINGELGIAFESIYQIIYLYDKDERYHSSSSFTMIDKYNEEQRLISLLGRRYQVYEQYFDFFMNISLYKYCNFERDRTTSGNQRLGYIPDKSFKDFPLALKLREVASDLKRLEKQFLTFDEYGSLKPGLSKV